MMARQNRVTPYGEIIATPARGTLMGNRGCLHDTEGNLGVARWRSPRWIACVLEFRGRHRDVMTPGRYTELFFLDEATALAAGHRPCAECRRADFVRFRHAWLHGNPDAGIAPDASIDEIDRYLHAERTTHTRQKVTYEETLAALPDGILVELPSRPGGALLKWRDHCLHWSPEGYTPNEADSEAARVTVLTPRSIVHALAAGYVPSVHPSAVRLTSS